MLAPLFFLLFRFVIKKGFPSCSSTQPQKIFVLELTLKSRSLPWNAKQRRMWLRKKCSITLAATLKISRGREKCPFSSFQEEKLNETGIVAPQLHARRKNCRKLEKCFIRNSLFFAPNQFPFLVLASCASVASVPRNEHEIAQRKTKPQGRETNRRANLHFPPKESKTNRSVVL